MKETKTLYFRFVASCSLLIFVFLGYTIKFYPKSHWLTGFDSSIRHFAHHIQSPTLTHFFKGISFCFNPGTITVITVLCVIYFIYQHRRLEAVWLAISMSLTAGLLNFLMKLIFMRQRPSQHLTHVTGYSFPSGHADGSLIFIGCMVLILWKLIHKQSIKWVMLTFSIILVILVGFSRIYLNVHYPSDVIGGWLFAIGWLGLTYPIFEHRRFIYEFKGGRYREK